jgi:hypothetical protein
MSDPTAPVPPRPVPPVLLALLAAFSGCEGGEDLARGDIVRNTVTGELRTVIDVGACGDLLDGLHEPYKTTARIDMMAGGLTVDSDCFLIEHQTAPLLLGSGGARELWVRAD